MRGICRGRKRLFDGIFGRLVADRDTAWRQDVFAGFGAQQVGLGGLFDLIEDCRRDEAFRDLTMATTVGLSFSRSTIGSAPCAIRRARLAATNTISKMLSMLSRQSSTVMRAIVVPSY